jgi:hypothetical protein|tara:strand:+ start:292 stop:816 length:525 start_codon:yes stop_codon:yes gene_type:complete
MKDFPIIRIEDFYSFSNGQQTQLRKSVIKQIKQAEWDNNYVLKEDAFTKNLYNQFVKAAQKHLIKFNLNPKLNRPFCFAVASNQDFIPSVNWHNHIMTSTINSVYYLHIPKKMKGGEIQFKNRLGKILTHKPKTNQLLIFPGWMWHNPINVESEELRISINMEIICDKTMEELF